MVSFLPRNLKILIINEDEQSKIQEAPSFASSKNISLSYEVFKSSKSKNHFNFQDLLKVETMVG
mgnify:FL=1